MTATETPISLDDHHGPCENTRPDCICVRPSLWRVCDEFKAWTDGDSFCAECGWTQRCHPETSAVTCTDEHPITDRPCRRDPCDGSHTADGLDPWRTEPEPTEETR